MEMLQQIFMTVVAAFALLILITKIASAFANGDQDHHTIHDFSNQLKSSKTKSKKKVRFAVDHDEFVVNKATAEPSETKSVVFEKDHGEIEADCEIENTNCDDIVIDYDQIKEVKTELAEKTVICEENVTNCNENQMCMKLLCDDGIDESEKEKEGLISDEDDSSDDDWEGVERSDLEKVFAVAANYGKLDDNLQSLDSNIQMQLYGLHKVATEGPCHEAQPMALKLSARAKWNAWQKLGNMNPDVAMEQYVTLLSEKVPEWSKG